MNCVIVVVVQVCFEVCEVYGVYCMLFDLVWYYCDEVVLFCKCILEEMLLCYNGMFVSVFELFVDLCEQVMVVNVYIELLCDFWIVEFDLQMVLIGCLFGGM